MNVKVTEYGLRIRGVTYEEVDAAAPVSSGESPDECAEIHGVAVEGDQDGELFMSFGELGDSFPEETGDAVRIRRWFGENLPQARVTWAPAQMWR